MDNEKDHLGALVWYADAIGLAKKDLEIQSQYQDLFKNKLDKAIKLRYSLDIKEPISFAHLINDDKEALIVTNKGNFIQKEDNHVYIIDLKSGVKQSIYKSDGLVSGVSINDKGSTLMFVEDNIRTYTAIDIVNKKVIYKKQSIYSNVKKPIFSKDGIVIV